MAILKQLAPKVIRPPSPKNRAWIPSTTEIPSIAAQGPKTIARSVAPTACPVVPPGKGMLNIIKTKEKAENTANTGTVRVARVLRMRVDRQIPERNGGCVKCSSCGWAEIAVGNMHKFPLLSLVATSCI